MDYRPEPNFYFDGGDLFYVELSIISFRNYILLVEKSFDEQKKNLSEKYAEHYKNLDNSDLFLHTTTSELLEIEQEFIQRFRKSIVIQIFSYLESELKSICNTHSDSTKSIYTVNDLKGNSDLDKVKKYLTKSMKIEVGKFDLWPFINNLRILRNKIVHENSTIQINDGDLKAIKTFSNNKFLLESENPNSEFYNIVFNNQDFLDECLNKIESFIQEIMKDYRPFY
ncbi:hypothetical protein AB3G33_10650 [Flavobacterium sp. WC2421]|uniref:hypothetical protein n=1 Tax=Flavobacterium sp. WC2421 TaxID=3234138 RepID=UPI0034668973